MTAGDGPGYPDHLLAREAAPPYAGEGPFALWHFSEEPSLGLFEPRSLAADSDSPRLVWAVDTRHAPMFWFPRDCPRGCVWRASTTTADDQERFSGRAAPTVSTSSKAAGWSRYGRAASTPTGCPPARSRPIRSSAGTG